MHGVWLSSVMLFWPGVVRMNKQMSDDRLVARGLRRDLNVTQSPNALAEFRRGKTGPGGSLAPGTWGWRLHISPCTASPSRQIPEQSKPLPQPEIRGEASQSKWRSPPFYCLRPTPTPSWAGGQKDTKYETTTPTAPEGSPHPTITQLPFLPNPIITTPSTKLSIIVALSSRATRAILA